MHIQCIFFWLLGWHQINQAVKEWQKVGCGVVGGKTRKIGWPQIGVKRTATDEYEFTDIVKTSWYSKVSSYARYACTSI